MDNMTIQMCGGEAGNGIAHKWSFVPSSRRSTLEDGFYWSETTKCFQGHTKGGDSEIILFILAWHFNSWSMFVTSI